ncbi:MAG: lactonase family protein [Leptospirales bacterium]
MDSFLRGGGVLLLILFASGCGGGGGGAGSGGGGPSEILYALSGNGTVTEIALNASSGALYGGTLGNSSQSITVGTNPLQFEFDPNGGSYAFVLNNENTPVFAGGILTATGGNSGSIEVFSVGSKGLSTSPVSTQPTGVNPVSMAIDSGGVYLAVADHGNGLSSGPGDVEVFKIGSGGTLTNVSPSTPPCTNPNKVLFAPGSNGSSSEYLYILCSSPEISSTPPTPFIFYCPISTFSSCPYIGSIGSNTSLFNLVVDPSGAYAVAPGVSGTSGILPEIAIAADKSLSIYANPGGINLTPFIPAGQPAIIGSGTSDQILVGNYEGSSSSFASGTSKNFADCPISTSNPLNCSASTLSDYGPIAMITNSARTALYTPLTGTPVVAGGSSSTGGVIQSCPINGTTISTSCTEVLSGAWPLSVTFDSNNHAFVPNYGSSSVSVYSVGTGGALTWISTLSVGPHPVSVLVR